MSILRAYLGVAGLTDVGYTLFLRNTAIGTRSTTDILDETGGWYSAGSVTTTGADNVRWDSTGTVDAIARETLQPSADEIAAALLKLDWTTVSGEATYSVLQALRFLRNEWHVASSVLTVKKENGTSAWTRTVQSTPGAAPIVGVT